MRKELRETLRDRRTILTLVLMPVLLYPLLSIAFQQFFLTGLARPSDPEYRVGANSEAQWQAMARFLELEYRPGEPRVRPYETAELVKEVREGNLDLGVRFPDKPFMPRHGQDLAVDVELLYLEDSPFSMQARDFLKGRLDKANKRFLEKRLESLQVTQRPEPVKMEEKAVPNPERRGTISLAALVPLILILMTITGAVYPAIDLTAGERERGTLEILVAAPVPRLGLLFAKYVAVLAVALLTALVNLATMTLTLVVSGLGPLLFGESGLSVQLVIQVFALLLLFAAFFSAVLLTLSSFARSFKEAQAYLVPLMLVSIAPGMMALVPGLKLAGSLTVAPLINIVLLARDLIEQTAEPAAAVVVILSTLLYGAAALGLAARIFGAEAVLYGDQGGWADLFRRPVEPRRTPTLSNALFCLALAFPAYFLVLHGLAHLKLPFEASFMVAGLANIFLFGGFPLVAAFLGRVRLTSGFQLHRPPAISLAAAGLLGVSLWPFAHEIVETLRQLGWGSLQGELMDRIKPFLHQWRDYPPLMIFIVFALGPAVFEELFFRGYLFSAVRARTGPTATIFATAILFGLFHLFVTDRLAVERLVPSTLLGVVLGWMCWRTGSVFPGMVFHTCHNGLLVMVAYYKEDLAEQFAWLREEQTHLPPSWLLVAAVGALIGALLIHLTCAVGGRREAAES